MASFLLDRRRAALCWPMRSIKKVIDSRAEIQRARDLIAEIQAACDRAHTVIADSKRIMVESVERERLERERLRDAETGERECPPQSGLRPFMQGSDLKL
ncbi:hypothetical protein [Alsobacter sp. SYSU BS001988]